MNDNLKYKRTISIMFYMGLILMALSLTSLFKIPFGIIIFMIVFPFIYTTLHIISLVRNEAPQMKKVYDDLKKEMEEEKGVDNDSRK